MKSESINKIITIILCIAVLICILVWIQSYYESKEGFQIADILNAQCEYTTIGSRGMYLCPDEDSAFVKLNSVAIQKIPVCYTNNSSLNFTDLSSNTYVCFDINGEPVFDYETGTYSEYNPLLDNDPMPSYGEQDSIMNSTAFNAGYNSFTAAYANTKRLNNAMSTIGIGNIKAIDTQLHELSTTYCNGTPQQKYQHTCAAIATALTNTNSMINDTSPNSLSNISTIMSQSLSTIKSATYNTFIPGFVDSYVINPDQMSSFVGNK